MKRVHMGWFVIVVLGLIAYFIFKKAQPVGGVTIKPAPGYGPGSTGLYSQVG